MSSELTIGSALTDIDDEALEDAAFELSYAGDEISWTDPEREEAYQKIAEHLRNSRGGDDGSGRLLRFGIGRFHICIGFALEDTDAR